MSASPVNDDRPAVEVRSIDFVPLAERHGKVWHQGPFWFTGNFVLLTMTVGFTGPAMGLSLGWTVLAIALGICFGTFFMAFHANQGPQLGLPQMIQSRAQFGSRGALIPFVATVFVYVGFIVFGVIVVTDGIQTFAPGPEWFWYAALVLVSIVFAVFGYDLLQRVQRWLTYLLMVVFVLVTVSALTMPVPATGAGLSWNGTAFLVQLSLAAGYNISYSVYVSDHSRYLPPSAAGPALIAWTYAGAALSAIWMMSVGALLFSRLDGADAVLALDQAGRHVHPSLGLLVVLVALFAQTTITGINAYGAMLTGLSAIDGFVQLRPTLRLRVLGLVVVGAVSLVLALVLPDDYQASFTSFVLLMLYFLVPWTAVNLVDFYLLRCGHYAIADIMDPTGGVYGRWSPRAMIAYAAGLLAMAPFASLSFYQGFLARRIGGADIAFLFGLTVSGGLFLLLSRGISRVDEAAAIARSQHLLDRSTP